MKDNVDVNGIRMRWEERGEGEPVVFIHSIPTGPMLWRHVIPALSHSRALAWEVVGCGRSIPQGCDREFPDRGRPTISFNGWTPLT